jgi:hypothetical protein
MSPLDLLMIIVSITIFFESYMAIKKANQWVFACISSHFGYKILQLGLVMDKVYLMECVA